MIPITSTILHENFELHLFITCFLIHISLYSLTIFISISLGRLLDENNLQRQDHGFIWSLNVYIYMLLTLPVNIPSQKTVMKMLHGLVVNNHNYNIIF